ncbi:uncharacterized protein LOC106641429 [Copidosoma floridanum]|uniref:uncharacterized protein LOC106641429 n=1 Tax=Copidosoma floridanum TaxID=29053 RepID=UPI0006C94CC0|nr:uncharacterized protein LOC106641429 [Copidosoma floridanum]
MIGPEGGRTRPPQAPRYKDTAVTYVMCEKTRTMTRSTSGRLVVVVVRFAVLLVVGGWWCAVVQLPGARAAAFPDWTDCPAVCRCKWTSGKKSALCPDAGLTSLPASLDPDMQVLDLSGNQIPALQAEIFKHAALLNLQRVYMRNAGIHEIDGDAFKDMRILVEVDLSDNHLGSLEAHTFAGNERLRWLVLSGNPLKILKPSQFPVLQHLRNLELQRCSLTVVHAQAFQRLAALETLRLDNNELEYLESESIVGLKRLKTLGLDNNPWSCDCKLRDFWRLLTTGSASHLYSVPQTCIGPARVQGKKWEEVRPSEFACEPTVYLPVTSIQEEMNGNVSLACLASGDPEPEVWWQLNGGPVNGTRRTPDELGPPGGLVTYSTSLATKKWVIERWSNLTIYNASDIDAGEYTCHARNLAGTARNTVAVLIPRVFSAPTLSQTDNWLLWISLAGGGVAALCISGTTVLLAVCVCGGARKRSRRAKVKLQGSASFGDQEKKLLDLSVTTTATTTSQQQPHPQQQHNHNHHHRQSPMQQQADLNDLHHHHYHHHQCLQVPDYELELEPCSVVQEHMCGGAQQASASVTVERLRLHPEPHQSPQQQQPVLCPVAVTTACPTRSFSPALPPNIFISVSLAGSQQPEHPSPSQSTTTAAVAASPATVATAAAVIQRQELPACPRPIREQYNNNNNNNNNNTTTTNSNSNSNSSGSEGHERCYPDLLDIGLSSFATLPRRNLRRELGSPYDNMGPRVTATGSSTFSLVEQPDQLTGSTGRLSSEPSQPSSIGNLAATAPLIQPPPEFVSL